jgi:hypothetical protein
VPDRVDRPRRQPHRPPRQLPRGGLARSGRGGGTRGRCGIPLDPRPPRSEE